MLISPRRPSSTMRIFSSATQCLRVARRMSLKISLMTGPCCWISVSSVLSKGG